MPAAKDANAAYWPDLATLPSGWRVVSIDWESGRARVKIERQRDHHVIISSGTHRLPSGAFNDVVGMAVSLP